jgi:Cytochrome c554 and c-prime
VGVFDFEMKLSTVLASGALFLSLMAAAWLQLRQPEAVAIIPSLTGEVEYCLTCHSDLAEISSSHPVESFGCVSCHAGERLALNADLAHSTMRGGANPSDLSVVEPSCGGADCHSGSAEANRDHIQRVMTSIQTTYAGAIAQIRYTFGAQPDLTALYGIEAVQAYQQTSPNALESLLAFDPTQESSPPVIAFAANCLSCHMRAEPLPEASYYRFTGCAACHTPTAGKDPEQPVHQLTTTLPYTQCNTCHNRGNYNLATMHFDPRSDQPTDRLNDYYQPIAQFVRCEWTLDCVDCHTRHEAMGDGNLYSSKSEIRYNQCRTCHGTLDELPLTTTIQSPDDLAMRMAFLNPVIDLKVGDTILVTEKGEPLWNIRTLADGTYELFGKASMQRFIFRPVMGTECEQKSDQQESRYCHECHAVER